MDNNEVYALFEDIKGNLKSINNKLENTPKVSNNQSGGQALAMDLTPVKELFNNSARTSGTDQSHADQVRGSEVKASNRILKLLWALKESFTQSLDEPQEHIHRHSFDIRSSKVFSLLVGMGVVCGLSIWGNIELWQSKRQYEDDALKFRASAHGEGVVPKRYLAERCVRHSP